MADPAALTLVLLDDSLAICRLEPDAEVPAWAWTGEPASVTRTRDEIAGRTWCRRASAASGDGAA